MASRVPHDGADAREAWAPAVGSTINLPPVGLLLVTDNRFGRVTAEDAWGRRHTYSLWWLRDIHRRGWKGAA